MKASKSPNSPIVASRIRSKQLDIQVPFSISKETLTHTDVVFVELAAETGVVGVGEAAPFSTLTFDTIELAQSAMELVIPKLTGFSTLQAMNVLSQLRREIRETSVTAYTALEMALWDLHGKNFGKPLAKIWGNGDQTSMHTDITMPIMVPSKVGPFWRLFSKHSFPIVKVKVSGNLPDDIAMIEALRQVIPPAVKISLDGNQGYQLQTAQNLIRDLAKLNIHPLFFEQPLAEDDWQGLQELTANLPIPVCLDETIKTADDARKMINDKSGNMINLKIMKSGIDQTREIISIAAGARIPMMIGGMMETEVAMGTSLQLACSSGRIVFADLDTPFFMKDRISKESPWHTAHSQLKCPFRPGHGIILSENILS